jgi:hypothetical protein
MQKIIDDDSSLCNTAGGGPSSLERLSSVVPSAPAVIEGYNDSES